MDDDTGEYPVPVLVPRAELEALARLILKEIQPLSGLALQAAAKGNTAGIRAISNLATAARRVLPALPAVDSVDRE